MAFGIGSAIKDFLGSAANKAADKLVPKELAPFLPMLAPMFMGPGAGIMSRYLMPQLLTALSSGKTAGDISGTGQVLTGLGSFLSDPGRMALSEQTKPVAGTADKITIDKSKLDPSFLESDLTGYGGAQGNVDLLDFQQGGRRSMYDATGGGLRQSPAVVTTPGIAPVASQPIYDISQIDNPTFMDYLKTGVNESRDFMQGTNVANTISGDEITVGDQSKLIGKPKIDIYDPAYQSAVRDRSALAIKFGKDPALQATGANYGVGNQALVRDAGFMQNLPRRAVAQGIQQIGPASTAIDKFKADQDAEATRLSEEQEAYNNAIAELGRYYGSLADPNERFGSYYNQGGRVGLNEGGSAENATNQFQMKLAELLEVGVPLEEAEKQAMDFMQRAFKGLGGGYADGGRIGLNMGGIMNAGSIPQTPAKPKRGLVNEPGGYAGKVSNKLLEKLLKEIEDDFHNMGPSLLDGYDPYDQFEPVDFSPMPGFKVVRKLKADGGTINAGSIPQTPVVPEGMQLDGRGGGFIPMGAQEKQDDVPAMLAKNEFVMTSDAVRAAGGGSIQKGAQRMYDMMNQLEAQV
jgi:hypothetical protein